MSIKNKKKVVQHQSYKYIPIIIFFKLIYHYYNNSFINNYENNKSGDNIAQYYYVWKKCKESSLISKLLVYPYHNLFKLIYYRNILFINICEINKM